MKRSKHRRHSDKLDPQVILWRLPRLMPVLLLVIAVCVGIWVWRQMTAPGALPFRHISVSANANYIPQKLLSAMVEENIQGGFFTLNTKRLRAALSQNPWVERVGIRRVWPNTLAVSITEREPLARWNDTGIISVKGNIFYTSAPSLPSTLPQIIAPTDQKDNIMPIFDKMQNALLPLQLKIAKLQVSPRLSWEVTLNNGIIVSVCRDDVLDRFSNFVNLYPRLIGDKAQNVVHVNLCYPNGLAIQWRHAVRPLTS